MRCFKKNERIRCKTYDPARTRTWNLLIRSNPPYPLGHEADIVYKNSTAISQSTVLQICTVILLFCGLHLANIIIAKGIGLMFPLKQLFFDSINAVNCTARNLRGFENICRNFSVATKTISNQSQYY